MRAPCPQCHAEVETRRTDVEANYPGSLVFAALQVRLGPEHERRCRHWRREEVWERQAR